LLKKTEYNKRVQGKKGAFYSLTRVGPYTFAKYRVVYRNNTKWVSAVIEEEDTKWGGKKMYLLLDHACSISQDNNGNFITIDEAHYICSILNSKLVKRYVENSSDSRSYKTNIPLKIVKYDNDLWLHKALSKISKLAHKKKLENSEINFILDYLVDRYIDESLENKDISDENVFIEGKLKEFTYKNWENELVHLIKMKRGEKGEF